MNLIVKRGQTSSFAILITSMSLINPAFATYNEPMPTPSPPASCDVEIDRLIRASELGSSLKGLNPGMEAHSFKVADLDSSMKVAVDAANAIPEPKISDEVAAEQAKLMAAIKERRTAMYAFSDEQDRLKGSIQILEAEEIRAPKSLAALKSQLISAERKYSDAYKAVLNAEEKLDIFRKKNSIFYSGTIANYVAFNKQKTDLMDAILKGPIGRAHYAMNAARAVIDRSMFRVPFDEVTIIDNSAVAEKARNELRALSGKMADAKSLMGKIESIDEILSSNPTLSRAELMAARDTIMQEIGKFGTLQEIQTALRAREKILATRPLIIFKNGGRIVGAVSGIEPSPNITAQGFHCKDGRRHGAWRVPFGFINYDHCENLRSRGEEYYGYCRLELSFASETLERFFFQSEKNVVPTKSPSPQQPTR